MMTASAKPDKARAAPALVVAGQRSSQLNVDALAKRLGATLLDAGDSQASVTGVRQDSRRVQPGDLFVALRGAAVDGVRFAAGAVMAGAVAVMIEPAQREQLLAMDLGCPWLVVERPRIALARAAAMVYGHPTEQLCVVGLTGTNGKTTTAHLLAAALESNAARAAVVGTLGYHFEGALETSQHTSPEADELQRVAVSLLRRGATHLVMEVSSIALAAQRVVEVDFDVVVFTNLTQDHLDYHGDMQCYAAAKDRLFLEYSPSVAVINVDDAHGVALAKRLTRKGGLRLWHYTTQPDDKAEVAALSLACTIDGIDMRVRTPAGLLTLRSPMIGRHNASNLLAALTIALSLGMDGARSAAALGQVTSVDGRLERVDDRRYDDVVALVDYAHTPDALTRTLESLRAVADGQIICVFGCGGDRDRQKRGPMGQVVARLADLVIVTNDNPRSERPEDIAAAVVAGIERHPDAAFVVELNRAHAIELAIMRAAPSDIVLVAGKGHEPYQIIGDSVTDFDDRAVVRAALVGRRRRS